VFGLYRVNATLTAKIEKLPTTQNPVTLDPVTGEPVFDLESETITIEVSLEPEADPTYSSFPGVESNSIRLVGRLIKPQKLPSAFIPNREYTISYYGSNGAIEGSFYLLPNGIGRLGLESVFGDYIAGYLLPDKN